MSNFGFKKMGHAPHYQTSTDPSSNSQTAHCQQQTLLSETSLPTWVSIPLTSNLPPQTCTLQIISSQSHRVIFGQSRMSRGWRDQQKTSFPKGSWRIRNETISSLSPKEPGSTPLIKTSGQFLRCAKFKWPLRKLVIERTLLSSISLTNLGWVRPNEMLESEYGINSELKRRKLKHLNRNERPRDQTKKKTTRVLRSLSHLWLLDLPNRNLLRQKRKTLQWLLFLLENLFTGLLLLEEERKSGLLSESNREERPLQVDHVLFLLPLENSRNLEPSTLASRTISKEKKRRKLLETGNTLLLKRCQRTWMIILTTLRRRFIKGTAKVISDWLENSPKTQSR